MPSPPAPAVALPAVLEIAWRFQDAVGTTDDENACGRGNAHLVEFNADQPPLQLRERLPELPWQTTPGHPQVRLPYLLVSSVTWALFVLHKTAAPLLADSYILSPRAMQRAWNRVVTLEFPLLELTMGTILDKLVGFVAAHPHADFELHDTDLTATEAPSRTAAGSFDGAAHAADKPHKRVAHIIMKAVEQDRRHVKQNKSLKLRESTFYTKMWGFAEVSGIFFTVLRVYGPILRHSYVSSPSPAWSNLSARNTPYSPSVTMSSSWDHARYAQRHLEEVKHASTNQPNIPRSYPSYILLMP